MREQVVKEEEVDDYEETYQEDDDVVTHEEEVEIVDNGDSYQENPMYNSEAEVYNSEPYQAEVYDEEPNQEGTQERKKSTAIEPLAGVKSKLDELGSFGYLVTLGVATLVVFIASIIKIANAIGGTEIYTYSAVILSFSTIGLVSCI